MFLNVVPELLPVRLDLASSVDVLMYRWGKRAAHNRAQIIYYLAENLEQRRSEFAHCLASMTGVTEEAGLHEVDLAIKRLFHWAAYADKYGGTVQVCMMLQK